MKKSKIKNPFTRIFYFAFIFAFIFYILGVATGYFTKYVIEKKYDEKLRIMDNEISFLEQKMNDFKVRDNLVATFSQAPDSQCDAIAYKLQTIMNDLNYYWSILPYRIEEYELNYPEAFSDPNFKKIKLKYTLFVIEGWLNSLELVEKCDSNLIPVLYFYSKSCSDCVKQGEELDKFKEFYKEKNVSVAVFTVDLDLASELTSVEFLRDLYKINSTPAIIIFDHVMQGKVYNYSELVNATQIRVVEGNEK